MTDKPATGAERNRRYRDAQHTKGLVQVRPWIPDTPEDRAEIYEQAKRQCERFERERGK